MILLLALAALSAHSDDLTTELQWMQSLGDGSADVVWTLDVDLVATGDGPAQAIAYETPRLAQALTDGGVELRQLPDIFEPEGGGPWRVERAERAFLAQPVGALRFEFGLSLPPADATSVSFEGSYRMLTGGTDRPFVAHGLRGPGRRLDDEVLKQAGVELSIEARELAGIAIRLTGPTDQLRDVELIDAGGRTLWPDQTSFAMDEESQTVSFLWEGGRRPLVAGVRVTWTADERDAHADLADVETARAKKKLGPFELLVTDARLADLSLEIAGRAELLTAVAPVNAQGEPVPCEDDGSFDFGGKVQRTFRFSDGLPDDLALGGSVRVGAEWREESFVVEGVKLPKRFF